MASEVASEVPSLQEMALKRVVEQVVEQDPEFALSLLTQALAARQLGPVADQEKIVAAIRERRLGPEGEESSRSVRGEEERSAETTRQILNSDPDEARIALAHCVDAARWANFGEPFDMVWYARREKTPDLVEEYSERYPDNVEALESDNSDWQHGFNSGVLAMGRVVLSLGTTDVTEMTKSFNVDNKQEGEPLLTEAEVLNMQRDEGWEEFPNLDT